MSLHSALTIVADHLCRQHCPVFDSTRALSNINDAFGFKGDAKLVSPHKPLQSWASGYFQALTCTGLRCGHILDKDDATFLAGAGVCVGKNGAASVRMDDVRAAVLAVHGNSVEAWIACKCGVSRAPLAVPFIATMLPLPNLTSTVCDFIKRVWVVCNGPMFKKHVPTHVWLQDGGAARVVRNLSVRNTTHDMLQVELLETLVPRESIGSAIVDAATERNTSGELRHALEVELGQCPPANRAIRRAFELRRAYERRPAAELVRECVRFIIGDDGCEDGDGGNGIISSLRDDRWRFRAIMEEAIERGLDTDPYFVRWSSGNKKSAGVLEFISRVREIEDDAQQLDLELDMSVFPEDADFYIDDVYDLRSDNRACATRWLSACWTSQPRTRYERVNFDTQQDVLSAMHFLRTAFDRRTALMNALRNVGLKLRDDSIVCSLFIAEGEYEGPGWPSTPEGEPDDALGRVVALMQEMNFLFTRTCYTRYMGVLRDSEVAKLAVVWDFKTANAADELPHRLRCLATAKDDDELRAAHSRSAVWDTDDSR